MDVVSPRRARTNTSHSGHVDAQNSCVVQVGQLLAGGEGDFVAHVASPLVACLAAWATAAPAPRRPRPRPGSCAAMRSRFIGPSPFTTVQNSSQSISPNSWWPGSSFQLSSGSGMVQPEVLGLGDGHVDELLAELVVGDPLDLPCHRLLGVGRLGVVGAEHHQRRPPPAVEGVLGHRLLLGECRGRGG